MTLGNNGWFLVLWLVILNIFRRCLWNLAVTEPLSFTRPIHRVFIRKFIMVNNLRVNIFNHSCLVDHGLQLFHVFVFQRLDLLRNEFVIFRIVLLDKCFNHSYVFGTNHTLGLVGIIMLLFHQDLRRSPRNNLVIIWEPLGTVRDLLGILRITNWSGCE